MPPFRTRRPPSAKSVASGDTNPSGSPQHLQGRLYRGISRPAAAHAEADLHRGLLDKLKDFLIELGRDFCFVGSSIPCRSVDGILRSICSSSIAA